MVDFSERLIEARNRRGLSPSALARLLKVTPTAVWNWEKNGVRPRAEALASIAKVLGVTEQFLLGGANTAVAADVPAIMEAAEISIAKAMGFDPSRVKLRLEISPK
ncbi:helix-turn-helix domain-containing protein [Devosia sp.]|uniref:helix-turn-helix domain-containing protein n=1 Tax=Devosia sp. TaxID=1871048 RepID=UPI003F72C04F